MTIPDLVKVTVDELNDGAKEKIAAIASEGMGSDVKRFIPSGSFLLDLVLRGGIPLGRCVEIYGRPGVGKTTLATHIMINCQKMGGVVIFIDSESKFARERAQRMGLATSSMIDLKVPSIERGFEYMTKTIECVRNKTGVSKKSSIMEDIPVVLVWDTLASAPSQSFVDLKEGESDAMGSRNRAINAQMRKFVNLLSTYQATCIFLNQVITNIGKMGAPEDSPGGWGIKHFSSVRIKMFNMGAIKTSTMFGVCSGADVIKNGVDGPVAGTNKVPLVITEDFGVNDIYSTISFLIDKKADKDIIQERAWIKINHGEDVYTCHPNDVSSVVIENNLVDWVKEKAARFILREGKYGYDLWDSLRNKEKAVDVQ